MNVERWSQDLDGTIKCTVDRAVKILNRFDSNRNGIIPPEIAWLSNSFDPFVSQRNVQFG